MQAIIINDELFMHIQVRTVITSQCEDIHVISVDFDIPFKKATLQFSFAVLSVVCGACYLCLFLVRPKEMWRFPQSLAFWIYASDLVKSLSLAIMSGTCKVPSAQCSVTHRTRLHICSLARWHPNLCHVLIAKS